MGSTKYDETTRTEAPLSSASAAAHSIALSDESEPSKPTTRRWCSTGSGVLVAVMHRSSRRQARSPGANVPADTVQRRSSLLAVSRSVRVES